jgi:nucleoside-diphosphate-sugar epimerase
MALWALSGGSGFLGVHLVRHLLARGDRVRSLDLEPQLLSGPDGIVGDVRDAEAARRLCAGAEVLVHAAAAFPGAATRRELASVNLDGTRVLLAAARAAGVPRVIFVSSAVVYGLLPPPVDEAAVPKPIEPYGRVKLAAEALCRAESAVVLRPTAFVGPERAGIFGLLFEWMRQGRRLYTLGSGENRYQLLAVEDLVRAVLLAGARPVAGETFNLGATRFGTVREELEGLARHAGSPSRVTPLPARPAKAALAALSAARLAPFAAWHYRSADHDFVLDVSRARERLGWQPRRSSAEALATAYDWYVENRARVPTGRSQHTVWRERALAVARRLS